MRQSLFCVPKGCARAFLGFFRAIRCISGAIHAELLHFCRRSWYTTGTEQYSVQYAIPIIPIEQKTVRQPQAGRFSVFCGCVWCTGSFQRICGAIRAQNRPKRAKRGTLNTDTALQADRGAGILARQACDQGTGHPRMEPAEKAGSGEITIAISRSILSNKRSKAVRRMPDGLAAFRYFKIGLTACALSVCALRSHPHSPFCRCATSSPGAGEVFPQRERQEHCRKLPHYI